MIIKTPRGHVPASRFLRLRGSSATTAANTSVAAYPVTRPAFSPYAKAIDVTKAVIVRNASTMNIHFIQCHLYS